MCIAAFIWQAHPLYPLLLLQNRDEYYNRPTKALAWWDVDGCEILGGRDEVAGGTWLACSRQGRVAFLTNVLELHHLSGAKTRGDLPLLFLKSTKSPMEFADQLLTNADQYNGFNLIVADIATKSMVYISNRPKGEPIHIQQVSPGLHVLSNAKLDSPWPKVPYTIISFTQKNTQVQGILPLLLPVFTLQALRLRKSVRQMLNKYGKNEVNVKEMIEKLMKDKVKADKSKLPGICALDMEFNLSSIFVEMDTPQGICGTRSTAALTIRASGEVSFCDKYLEKGAWFEKTINYHIQNETSDFSEVI
ncbi:hypothetical protein ES288_A01G115500v1 [Gossypium darwinii]|uniref:Uncharacterized protein n=1 Tax=Gossypium darwinii TaxID=34276 RepID=A0A5D2HK71_GOSDA|nr:hypothetical protein ES288_A01G115500v1 [Gossypium darwinii]